MNFFPREKPDFASVYEVWYDRVYRYARMLLLNRADAEDVTADAFLAAYEHYGRFDPAKASIGTWLTRIAHNRAVNLLRSPARVRRAEMPEGWDAPDATDAAGQAEDADLLFRLYARLTPEEREFLNLRYVMELKDREIAALLSLPEKTVNKRYQRLLARCRGLMDGVE